MTDTLSNYLSIEHPITRSNADRHNFTIVNIGNVRVAISYKTIIGFNLADGEGWIVRENTWGPTTGKHLNYLNSNKDERLASDLFERVAEEVLANIGKPTGRNSIPTEPFAGETGCWLDSHMGWHNTYRAIDIATDYGYVLTPRDRIAVEEFRDGAGVQENPDIEWVHEIADNALEWLNKKVLPDDLLVTWFEGDLHCAAWECGDPDNDTCELETCAHGLFW